MTTTVTREPSEIIFVPQHALAWGGARAPVTLPIQQEELAELLGLSRRR
ncbi:MAG: hypothetical protein H5U13_06455 [Parvibaculum sp.]|nr:hypothetical protein [Parvibaculum sp.]